MKLILTVLAIRMIMELVTKKKTGKNKDVRETNSVRIQHPAEFELR